jgi:hypothetical protein
LFGRFWNFGLKLEDLLQLGEDQSPKMANHDIKKVFSFNLKQSDKT